MALINKLKDLADAVRERSGVEGKLTLEEMATVVKEIPEPVIVPFEFIGVHRNDINGYLDLRDIDWGDETPIDGFNPIHIDVIPNVKDIKITENGTYSTDESWDGFGKVEVDVKPKVTSTTFSKNGTYYINAKYDGWNKVTVNAPQGVVLEEPIVLSGDQSYGCAGAISAKFIELFPNKIFAQDLTDSNYMFYNSPITEILFDIYYLTDELVNHSATNMFHNCVNLILPPVIMNFKPAGINSMFAECRTLMAVGFNWIDYNKETGEHTYDWHTWDFSNLHENEYSDSCSFLFYNCFNLREVNPDLLKELWNIYPSCWSTVYHQMFYGCKRLGIIERFPVIPMDLTENYFNWTFDNCYSLKWLVFDWDEDGAGNISPKKARWTNQVIDLSQYVGYAFSRDDLPYEHDFGDVEITTFEEWREYVEYGVMYDNIHPSMVCTVNKDLSLYDG
jgi:hypothetical protein